MRKHDKDDDDDDASRYGIGGVTTNLVFIASSAISGGSGGMRKITIRDKNLDEN